MPAPDALQGNVLRNGHAAPPAMKANGMNELIRNTSYDQAEIIRNILRLHVSGGKIDCDPTYSIGAFYNGTGIDQPSLRFDINPQVEGVTQADARCLPIDDASVNCMMIDPPFLATTGKSLAGGTGNRINRRFGVFPDEKSLHGFYRDALKEAYRVLKPGGVLIFKCQDKTSSGAQYFSHCFIWQEAVAAGFYPLDMFILLAKSRLVADWQKANQKHARKFACYFWVFKKADKRIQYT